MQRHSNHKAIFLLGQAFATLALAPWAVADEALLDRPGFGYAIRFTTGPTAEALLPVKRQALPDRPSFGYTINFRGRRSGGLLISARLGKAEGLYARIAKMRSAAS